MPFRCWQRRFGKERTALAMDGRAFGALETRTYYKQTTFGPRDYLFVGCFWIISVAIVSFFDPNQIK